MSKGPAAENNAPTFTAEELTQWRVDAHHINSHAGLFMPETSTMAWRFLALLDRVDQAQRAIAEQESCASPAGECYRYHDGCYVADSLASARGITCPIPPARGDA